MKLMRKIYLVSGALLLITITAILVYVESNARLNSGNIKKVQNEITNNETQTSNSQKQIRISITNLTVNRINDNDSNVQVSFDVTNPSERTIILEEIQYNIIVKNTKLVSGSIGQKLEGFLTPAADIYPIIGNSSIMLKDKKMIDRHNFDSTIWNNFDQGKTSATINGTISYKSTTGLESNRSEKDFRFTVPTHHNLQ
jgi:hypothetical protein